VAEEGLPDVLRAPTGAGKTLAAVLPWLYRRTAHPEPAVRAATPHWLAIVLPQRTLVEQTAAAVRDWLGNLGSPVGLHVLMGGVDADDRRWKLNPSAEGIFVGTQDMVLSRLLMRGFAESRASWPMTFGLLHAGVQFVFDEVQLMGPGLNTSLQLQGLRAVLGTAVPCRSMWMSATLNPAELATADFAGPRSVVELTQEDRTGALRTRLEATRTVRRLDLGELDAKRYPKALAQRVAAEHRPGTRTLVVLNTVDRAVEVAEALATDADVVLLHSRFRPADRDVRLRAALATLGPAGTIVVTTQVLEAGVDLTSDTLVTETAPWSSIVQRAGRCNRDGAATDARLLWTPPPSGRGANLPYEAEEHEHTAEVLALLEGRAMTGGDLAQATGDRVRPNHPMLRRRDLLDLFDTGPDLSGADIDVSPYIRDAEDRTVSVAWRILADMDAAEKPPPAARDELCPAPIGQVRDLVERRAARVVDQTAGRWRPAAVGDVRPTAVVVLDAGRGGYTTEHGFAPRSAAPVEPLTPAPAPLDATDTDPLSEAVGRWVPLTEHLADVQREAAELLRSLGELPGICDEQRDAIVLAGLLHDLGKAHPAFQATLRRASSDHPPPEVGESFAKSGGNGRLHHQPPHFRHELASALLLRESGLLDGVAEPELVTYLVLAHHGKVRLGVRGKPDEPPDRVLGVVDGAPTGEATLPDGRVVPATPLSLAPTRLGAGSLTDAALRLRDRTDLGPFRLAFCEAVLRSADWRASSSYDEGSGA
jgi:CRISPR-associated endonuclease/helicase Cas3